MDGDEDPNIYFPSADMKALIAEVSKVEDDVRKEGDLNKCSVSNVARSNNEASGSKAFYCLWPLPKNEISKLEVDGENVVKSSLHGPQRNLVDCVYCHARQQQLVAKTDVLCRQAENKSDVRGVQKVFCPLASARQIPMELWKSPGAKESAKGWEVPKMVGIEGLRMEIPHPDTPLARWRVNPRKCLSYTDLVTCPDVMSHNVNKDWTDMQCIKMLERLQGEYTLREGTISASVFAAAITHFTSRALDEGQKASQSMEEGEHHMSLTQDVESWGLRKT